MSCMTGFKHIGLHLLECSLNAFSMIHLGNRDFLKQQLYALLFWVTAYGKVEKMAIPSVLNQN